MTKPVATVRIRSANTAPVRADGDYVLYWMVAQRRLTWNYGLDRALELARELGRPVLVLEALRTGYRWASDRMHRFILDGMADNLRAARAVGLSYYPYVESEEGAGKGLLAALAGRACAVITDHYPCFFLPRMVAAAATRLDVKMETVDSNGLLPLWSVERDFTTAYSFRRYLHKTLPAYLRDAPSADPLAGYSLGPARIPAEVGDRWLPCPDPETVDLSQLPIDHTVEPVPTRGGAEAGAARMRTFLDRHLGQYGERYSGLSPYMHFGHVGSHQVFHAVAARESWSPDAVAPKPTGQRAGWWNMSEAAESFLDELVTWREIGFVFAHRNPDTYTTYESLPGWAQKTLEDHAVDPRPETYDLDTLARAETNDEIWNSAQRQLLEEGIIHSQVRMLWGKKILEWSATPQQALERLIELNNRYAIDGRDPNSYSGIFWVLGRFDRAWGPERPIYGKVRYMTSERMLKKVPALKERMHHA